MARRVCWSMRRPSTISSTVEARRRPLPRRPPPQRKRAPNSVNLLRRSSVAGLILAVGAPAFAASGDTPRSTLRAELAPIQPGLDYHSFANVEQFRITHLELNLRVDF